MLYSDENNNVLFFGVECGVLNWKNWLSLVELLNQNKHFSLLVVQNAYDWNEEELELQKIRTIRGRMSYHLVIEIDRKTSKAALFCHNNEWVDFLNESGLDYSNIFLTDKDSKRTFCNLCQSNGLDFTFHAIERKHFLKLKPNETKSDVINKYLEESWRDETIEVVDEDEFIYEKWCLEMKMEMIMGYLVQHFGDFVYCSNSRPNIEWVMIVDDPCFVQNNPNKTIRTVLRANIFETDGKYMKLLFGNENWLKRKKVIIVDAKKQPKNNFFSLNDLRSLLSFICFDGSDCITAPVNVNLFDFIEHRCSSRFINSFRGYSVDETKIRNFFSTHSIQWILTRAKFLINFFLVNYFNFKETNEEDDRRNILEFMFFMSGILIKLENPLALLNTIFHIVGTQGCGKSFLGRLLTTIVGPDYVTSSVSGSSLYSGSDFHVASDAFWLIQEENKPRPADLNILKAKADEIGLKNRVKYKNHMELQKSNIAILILRNKTVEEVLGKESLSCAKNGERERREFLLEMKANVNQEVYNYLFKHIEDFAVILLLLAYSVAGNNGKFCYYEGGNVISTVAAEACRNNMIHKETKDVLKQVENCVNYDCRIYVREDFPVFLTSVYPIPEHGYIFGLNASSPDDCSRLTGGIGFHTLASKTLDVRVKAIGNILFRIANGTAKNNRDFDHSPLDSNFKQKTLLASMRVIPLKLLYLIGIKKIAAENQKDCLTYEKFVSVIEGLCKHMTLLYENVQLVSGLSMKLVSELNDEIKDVLNNFSNVAKLKNMIISSKPVEEKGNDFLQYRYPVCTRLKNVHASFPQYTTEEYSNRSGANFTFSENSNILVLRNNFTLLQFLECLYTVNEIECDTAFSKDTGYLERFPWVLFDSFKLEQCMSNFAYRNCIVTRSDLEVVNESIELQNGKSLLGTPLLDLDFSVEFDKQKIKEFKGTKVIDTFKMGKVGEHSFILDIEENLN